MTKWSNIIREPGGGGVDGILSNLVWNRFEVIHDGGAYGFLPNTDNGPGGIPADLTNVCFIKATGMWPVYSGDIEVRFDCDFTAPFNMVITKVKFRGRHDVGIGSATFWGAEFKIWINGRAKRIDPEIGHLRHDSWDIWDHLTNANWSEPDQVLTIRPIVVPKGAYVTVQLNMRLFVISGTDWVRVGNFQLGYRAPMDRAIFNYNQDGQTVSWLPRKECLPEDSMKFGIRLIDAEGVEVGGGTPVQCWRGANPLSPFPLFLSSEGMFDSFAVLNTPGTEIFTLKSEDADGSEGNWLGFGRDYNDKVLGLIMDGNTATYPDDDPNNNLFNLPQIVDSFNVAKRTPRLYFDVLPSKLTLGLLTNFKGHLEDPEQSGMVDFLKNVNVRIMRDTMGLESQSVKSDGAFDIPRTLSVDDLGKDRAYYINSSSSPQYNLVNSSGQVKTVWQIIQTSLRLLLDTRPPFLGTKFNVTTRLADETGAPLSGFLVRVFHNDTSWAFGLTDQLGEFTKPKLLDTLGQSSFQVMTNGGIIDGYKEYKASTSEVSIIDVAKKTLNTIISRFELERPDLLKGELATFHVSLTDDAGTPIGPTLLSLQRQVGTDWVIIKNVEIDQNGNGTATWDASDLLGDQKSVTIVTRAVYDGGENMSLEPWEYYNPSESSPRNLTISALAPNLGHLLLRAKLDNKYFEELPGTKTITFTIDPPDVNNNATFDHPQTVTVNPGRYNVDCSLTVEDVTFTRSDSRDVGVDEEVLMEFSFMSTSPPGGTGRLNISIECSRTVINAGESFEVSGNVTVPTRLRAVPVRRIAVKIKVGTTVLEKVRTDRQGYYSATIRLTAVGEQLIYAEISGPFGNINIAKSPSIRVVVV